MRKPERGYSGRSMAEEEIREKRIEDREGLKWHGFDKSIEILPHLNLSWKEIEEIYEKSGKPVGDLGSSFSTLPTEGQLRDVDIVPIDMMHDVDRRIYPTWVYERFNDWRLQSIYQDDNLLPGRVREEMGTKKPYSKNSPLRTEYWQAVKESIDKVKGKYVHADLAHIPLKDRSLSVSIAHDSVPKHSNNLEEFLEKQLPEILRVTDETAYIYPLSIFETTKEARRATNEEWAEKGVETVWEDSLTEKHVLYEDPDALEKIKGVAERLGFEFELERGSEIRSSLDAMDYDKLNSAEQQEAMLGVFRRRR